MATIWPGSRVPYLDANGDPMVGAKLRFYNAATSTPQPVYSDGALSVTRDQPVLADARGMFPVIYMSPTPGSYRQTLHDADDGPIFDDDDIDVAQAADFVPPDAGETSIELLARTGDLKPHYGTTATSGWVRAAGRTIGSAASGATERANDDCEDLFLHLWTVDATLTVSGGRGASAAGDWAANKTITLPDLRDRSIFGLATMGNSDAGLIADAYVDGGETTSTLGATAGVDDVALTEAQLASHTHGNGTLKMPNHGHPFRTHNSADDTSEPPGGFMVRDLDGQINHAAYTGAVSATSGQQIGGSGEIAITGAMASTGSGSAHNNMPPAMFMLWLIKL